MQPLTVVTCAIKTLKLFQNYFISHVAGALLLETAKLWGVLRSGETAAAARRSDRRRRCAHPARLPSERRQ